MRTRERRRRRVLALAAALALAGCGGGAIPPPAGWLPRPREALTSARGAWISVEVTAKEKEAAGELIAIDADSLILLRADTLAAFPTDVLGRARIFVHSGQAGRRDFVAPGTSPRSMLRRSTKLWLDLAAYARFPQGLPPELDRTSLGRR